MEEGGGGTQKAIAWKVGKIPTPVFLVNAKVTPVNSWVSAAQKRESTKLSAKEAPDQEWCLAKIPSARKIFLSPVLVLHLSNLQQQCGFVFFSLFLLGFSCFTENTNLLFICWFCLIN